VHPAPVLRVRRRRARPGGRPVRPIGARHHRLGHPALDRGRGGRRGVRAGWASSSSTRAPARRAVPSTGRTGPVPTAPARPSSHGSGAVTAPAAGSGSANGRAGAASASRSPGGDPAEGPPPGRHQGVRPRGGRGGSSAGLVDLGENYAQELVAKAPVLAEAGLRCAGTRSVACSATRCALAPVVHLWQTVDRLELGREIARRAPGSTGAGAGERVGGAQKGGCAPGRCPTSSPPSATRASRSGPDDRRPHRCTPPMPGRVPLLRRLADDLDLPVRSMGMSGDLEVAVQEGATMVRVGSALFGPRPPVPGPYADIPLVFMPCGARRWCTSGSVTMPSTTSTAGTTATSPIVAPVSARRSAPRPHAPTAYPDEPSGIGAVRPISSRGSRAAGGRGGRRTVAPSGCHRGAEASGPTPRPRPQVVRPCR
jgi:PLP dependent protein